MPMAIPLLCPLCREPLAARLHIVSCARGHSFDVARAGYVNLALGREAGDTRDMVQARARFLSRGHFEPIATALRVLAQVSRAQFAKGDASSIVLDAGCGEGYYLRHLAAGASLRGCGVDNSREAIRAAARRGPGMCWIVADIWKQLPLADESCDVLINVFAPRNVGEFTRVLAPSGLLLVVIPEEDHLVTLRQHVDLLSIEPGKEAALMSAFGGAFEISAAQSIRYDIELNGRDAADLVMMSPSFQHARRDDIEHLTQVEQLRAGVRVRLLAFRRAEKL